MDTLPDSIKLYLATLDGQQLVDGYLCLTDKHSIVASRGCVGNTDLNTLDHQRSPTQSIPILEGLLQDNANAPTVIYNVHVDKDYYFDIHLFHDHAGIWVLFIDKSHSGKLLQQEQQVRLSDDFNNDKRRTGS